jgi:asparagine synthase (glutamine-hydrolysing)
MALSKTGHPATNCLLRAEDVPQLAESVQRVQDEPFGGLPTLAYSHLFATARQMGTIVLLDGQGMDEQWGGYDYYAAPDSQPAQFVQGTRDRAVRMECLEPDFRRLAPEWKAPAKFSDRLRNLQVRDALHTKIPRALRFNDRASMRSSTELREPFLDHRLFELALRQPAERKILNGVRKRLLRELACQLAPAGVVEAPKRPLQTPQREWLRGPLKAWAEEQIRAALDGWAGTWLDTPAVLSAWREFLEERTDNSFFVWQWISLGMITRRYCLQPMKMTA